MLAIPYPTNKTPAWSRYFDGRASGTRTHGLFVPNEARYQLRYSPIENGASVFTASLNLLMLGSTPSRYALPTV